ncbi:MAG TPA: carboxypeptidase-like regulatory domain-containing protein [Candidatus Sulfotelmatobacter sp.]|jgi:hypothetical protein|nr:carboxypeptidase-like regulatory domain-containing protein [Candidatus Sulfotelmatobacter sp.]
MKFLISVIFWLLYSGGLAAQTALSSDNSAPLDKEKCSVSGSVLRQDTGEPLKKAKVTLINHEKWEDSVFEITDEQGQFLLDNLPPGSYSLSVSRPGFVETSYGQGKTKDPGAVLTLTRGQNMTGLIFKLQRTAVVTGRVLAEDGELVTGARIAAIRVSGRGKMQEFQDVAEGTHTNDLGEFRIFDLEPGRYYFAAVYNPWSSREGFDPPPKHHSRIGFPPVYYPNTLDASKAQTVTVAPGQETSALDFRMQPAPLVTVSGKVLNLAPVAEKGQASVTIIPRSSELAGSFSRDNFQTPSKDGAFVIHGVYRGSYYLQAIREDRETRTFDLARTELEISDTDVEGAILIFNPHLTIRGQIAWDNGKPSDLDNFNVELAPATEQAQFPRMQAPKADGSFVLKNVTEGEYYLILISSNKNCFAKSARIGTSSMADGKLSIRAGDDALLEVLVSCRAPRLEGQVLTGESLPAVGVYVVLIPEPPRANTRKYAAGRTDQNGRFSLQGVAPGDYKLFSWDSVEENDWYDDEWLRPFEAKGVSVHLEEGERKNIDLTIIETSP